LAGCRPSWQTVIFGVWTLEIMLMSRIAYAFSDSLSKFGPYQEISSV